MNCKRTAWPALRSLAAALLAGAFATPQAARPAGRGEVLARGYSIVAATVLPGSFTGCVRQHRLAFADGSIFACARTAAQAGYDPRVYILRLQGAPPSVVLVGARVQAGELLRLQLHDYPVPLRMNADPLAAPPPDPGLALQPVAPLPSIDTLTRQQNAPLSEQQARLPIPAPKNGPNR